MSSGFLSSRRCWLGRWRLLLHRSGLDKTQPLEHHLHSLSCVGVLLSNLLDGLREGGKLHQHR